MGVSEVEYHKTKSSKDQSGTCSKWIYSPEQTPNNHLKSNTKALIHRIYPRRPASGKTQESSVWLLRLSRAGEVWAGTLAIVRQYGLRKWGRVWYGCIDEWSRLWNVANIDTSTKDSRIHNRCMNPLTVFITPSSSHRAGDMLLFNFESLFTVLYTYIVAHISPNNELPFHHYAFFLRRRCTDHVAVTPCILLPDTHNSRIYNKS